MMFVLYCSLICVDAKGNWVEPFDRGYAHGEDPFALHEDQMMQEVMPYKLWSRCCGPRHVYRCTTQKASQE
jgi:hypothetical protein